MNESLRSGVEPLKMWRTDTYWFDVAVVMTFLMLGQLFLGRFSEYQPRSRRLLKSAVGVAILIGLAVLAGRVWMYALLGVMLGAILVVHGCLLPTKGVNGWTMEPRDQYYRIMGLDSSGRRGGRTPEG